MHKIIISGTALALLTPVLVLAQFGEIDSFFGDISSFINNILIPLLFAVALFFFLYGVFNYFIVGKNLEEKKKEGRDYMIWSIVGFVLMVSVFGIVNLIAGGFGFSDDENISNIPNVPTTNR